MLSSLTLFKLLVAAHIASGSIGLISFWLPVFGHKGSASHIKTGKLFINTMLITGTVAVLIATTTLLDPTGTHPHLSNHPLFADPANIQGIFGWMMLYLATLTINLAWQGRNVMRNRHTPERNLAWHNLLSQALLTAASANCLWQGWQINQVMMMALSIVGFATVGTNLWYSCKKHPTRAQRLKEHIKCLVGAGISVYTAFLAFGAVRLMPELALTPALWSVPLVTGLTLIIYHQRAVALQFSKAPALQT